MFSLLRIKRDDPSVVVVIGYAPTEDEIRALVSTSQMAAREEAGAQRSTKYAYSFIECRKED